MKRILALWAGLGLLSLSLAAAEVGQPAPDFTGTDIHGRTHKLGDYKGKIVVLESYNLDCPYVRHQYRSGAIQELQRDLGAQGVVWLLVNSVSPKHPGYRRPEAAQKEWTAQKIAAAAWLDDGSGRIGKAYGMKTTPHLFVIDQAGVLAYQGALDDRAATEGDPRTARNYVREAVQKLKAGERPVVTQTKPYGCGVKYGN